MSSIISVENLSKRYIIGHQRDASDGLRHRLEDAFRHPFRRLRSLLQSPRSPLPAPSSDGSPLPAPRSLLKEEFWALKDVSFEIKQGDIVGIIGRNGAGKSTLLKILSRITEPTKGRIHLRGRVASLLEVGTGFHQELTGRENIFLNGAILGMSKLEIKRKFDEIVAFSEIEKFLDTPVKRYSSGMYVRLAFAVAAHLEPEILIVDEVLAVGDAQFQKKCLGKMGDVAHHGRTILFVSHNMAAVRQLCTEALLLDQGKMVRFGSTASTIDAYLDVGVEYSGSWRRAGDIPAQPGVYLESFSVRNQRGEISGHLDSAEGFAIELQARSTGEFSRAQIVLRFTNQDGVIVFSTCNTDSRRSYAAFKPGEYRYSVRVPGRLLAPGTYTLQVVAHIPRLQVFDIVDNTFALCIEDTGSLRTLLQDDRLGAVEPVLDWVECNDSKAVPFGSKADAREDLLTSKITM